MLFADLAYIFQWWFIWLLIGIVFLPLTARVFSSFFDKGYIFSKILGILILSYVIWFLSSLKLIPFSTTSIFVLWLVFVAISSITYLSQRKKEVSSPLPIRIFIFEEILFLLGLIFWSFIRAHEPSIHGLEKYMDFGFINSILRTEYFPPKDLWMTPLSINYYYFGHLIVAVITKIAGIDSIITYNLFLATLFGLTLSASFSIGANLYHLFLSSTKAVSSKLLAVSGLLSAFLVTLGGNLHTIYAFFQTYVGDRPVPFWQLPLMLNPSGYWYPNATRFIPFTIHEFPLYSFVVADLHGHVLNIPFVLLTIALLIKMFFTPNPKAMRASPLQYTDYILLCLLIAISLMANVLDGPIYLLVIFFVLLAKKWSQENKLSFPLILNTLYLLLIIAIMAIIFSLPFWLSFKPFASGIGVLCAPTFLTNIGKIGPFLFEADRCARSPLWMLAILWGFFYFIIFGFLFYTLKISKACDLTIFKKFIENYKLKIVNSTDIFVLTLALASTFLILIPEFFYAKDIYPAHYRANTVFKFGYQAFIILGLISGYMITRLISKFFFPYYLILIPLFLLVATYPYFAINSYYGNLKTYQGLNGINYLSPLYPSDYKAILWLRSTLKGQPVILEAQGDSYTDFARVSSNTGLPTVIGWPVHEWLWRGSYDEAGKRAADVQTLYETPDLNLAKQLIEKYNIEYVFIGTLERQKYTKLSEEKFITLGKLVFEDGITRIYQIN